MRKKALWGVGLVLLAFGRAWALDPVTVTDANGVVPLAGGLPDLESNFDNNPRPMTVSVFNHPFSIQNLTTNSGQTTSLNFVSPELGINKTFTGTSTSNTFDALKDFLKSDAFLGQFYALLNGAGAGPGGTYSGSPLGTIDATALASLTSVFGQSVQTESEEAKSANYNGVQLGVGLSKFDSQGFKGSDVKVTPAYSWKLGEKKADRLNLSVPIEQISVEGLKTYRAGSDLQYLHSFYLPADFVWKIGPDLSYSYLGSVDVPAYTGTIGGGVTSVLNKQIAPYFGNLGLYYGRFQHLGGIDTGLKANVYSYGLQLGRRIAQRWVLTGYGIGTSEDVNKANTHPYWVGGLSVICRVYKAFKLEVSVNRTFGIPGFSDTSTNLGSAWNF